LFSNQNKIYGFYPNKPLTDGKTCHAELASVVNLLFLFTFANKFLSWFLFLRKEKFRQCVPNEKQKRRKAERSRKEKLLNVKKKKKILLYRKRKGD